MLSLLFAQSFAAEPVIGNCTTYQSYIPTEIKKGTPICVQASRNTAYYLVAGKPLKITGKKSNGDDIATVQNAFMITGDSNQEIQTYYEITSEENQSIETLQSRYYHSDEKDEFISVEERTYAVIKNEYTGNVEGSSKISESSIETKMRYALVLNPNIVIISGKPGDNSIIHSSGEELPLEAKVALINVDPAKDPSPGATSIEVSGEFTVKAKSTEKSIVDQVFGLRPSTIYSKDDDNEALYPIGDEEKGGLSAGAIAGIVIGCVAFVAIVGFCIYWFVFRKKSSKVASEE